MKQTQILMGMPITVEVLGADVSPALLDSVFAYFDTVDRKFSTYKEDSEISRINRHELTLAEVSADMVEVFGLSEEMREATGGFFNIWHGGGYDPSGLVKGWAIDKAARMIQRQGFMDYYVEAGGDIQAAGKNKQGRDWRVGIRSPFNLAEIVKVLTITDRGVATSGTYARGQHIYNPKDASAILNKIVSLTVIGPDIYQADCYATAAFAMGAEGIDFIESLEGFEGYSIDQDGLATYTSHFARYIAHD